MLLTEGGGTWDGKLTEETAGYSHSCRYCNTELNSASATNSYFYYGVISWFIYLSLTIDSFSQKRHQSFLNSPNCHISSVTCKSMKYRKALDAEQLTPYYWNQSNGADINITADISVSQGPGRPRQIWQKTKASFEAVTVFLLEGFETVVSVLFTVSLMMNLLIMFHEG